MLASSSRSSKRPATVAPHLPAPPPQASAPLQPEGFTGRESHSGAILLLPGRKKEHHGAPRLPCPYLVCPVLARSSWLGPSAATTWTNAGRTAGRLAPLTLVLVWGDFEAEGEDGHRSEKHTVASLSQRRRRTWRSQDGRVLPDRTVDGGEQQEAGEVRGGPREAARCWARSSSTPARRPGARA